MAIAQRVAPAVGGSARRGERAVDLANANVERYAPRATVRIAYLTNLYPAISHSFIRTEIEALERAGCEVSRFSVRRSTSLSDDSDHAEAARTDILLDIPKLVSVLIRQIIAHPVRTTTTFRAAIRQTCRSGFSRANLLRAGGYLAEAVTLADAMRRAGLRHVHAHFGTNSASVTRLAARLSGVSYSFTVHGPDEFDAPSDLDLGGKIADAAFTVAVSSFGRSQLMRWSDPAHWNRIAVVPCSVAPRFLAAEPRAADTRRLVCVARLSAQKGLPLLIEAVGKLHDLPPFRIEIIGDGDQRPAIEARIADLGIGDRVRLLGWCSPERVLEEVATACAFVLPSFAEGLPVGIMEALALGRPVIATAIAGIPELVDAQTGWLIPAGCVNALSDAIRAALDAPLEVLASMGAVGQIRVRDRHDPDASAAILADLFARHA
ncbi:glycosyltransferase family 4 protein [Sphingomonas sp. AX6]|uniref:glycosyltransferase family 4 protein n=1 Tax=Sphingomonas sp. AX6 TaxID=2653171 RepID=UPI001358EC93|nr:glycosyltransferase family 4 protein [Sphingomonas sp. AX6]